MAITHAIPNQTIQAGQSIDFVVPGNPASTNNAVLAIGAQSVNRDDPAWQGFILNADPLTLRVVAPNNAQIGDDVTLTINYVGFDGNGNQIDQGVATVQYTVVGDDTFLDDCEDRTIEIDNSDAVQQIFAGRFTSGTSLTYNQVVSIDNISPATNAIQINDSGAVDFIEVSRNLPNGTYTLDVTVETADGEQCVAQLTLVKDVDDTTPTFDCIDISDISRTQGQSVNIPASSFNANAVAYTVVNITPNVPYTIDTSGTVDILQISDQTEQGVYTIRATVEARPGVSCTTTFDLTIVGGTQIGENIIDCVENPPQWVNGAPTVQCRFKTTAQAKLTSTDGNALNVPVENVSATFGGTTTGVVATVTNNLGNGIYAIEIDATNAVCTGVLQATVMLSATA